MSDAALGKSAFDADGLLDGIQRAKAIGEAEGRLVQALKGAIADAQQKMAEQEA